MQRPATRGTLAHRKHERAGVKFPWLRPLCVNSKRTIRVLRITLPALVFATGQGGPLSADNLRKKSLRTACSRAGLTRIDWHTLRHTHGTLLHSQGTPLKVAQAQLGHSHMATTLEVYTHASVSAQRDAVNLLEGQLFPNVPKFDGSGNTAQEEPQLLQ